MHAVTLTQERTRVWRIALVLVFALATAVSARVTVYMPFTPVPLTLQVLVVLTSGLVLGSRGGLLSQVAYMQLVLMGAPLTASGLAGPAAFVSPTAGYLWAFPVAAGAAGWVVERYGRTLIMYLLAGIAGLAAIYGGGLLWLTGYSGSLSKAWKLGVAPFLVADALKVTLAASVMVAAKR